MSLETDYIRAIQASQDAVAARIAERLDPPTVETPPDPWRLAKAAKWYAENGVPIFPIARNSKRPALPRAHPDVVEQSTCKGDCGRLGHGFRDATTDSAHIRAWWTRNPHYNIGMPTGRHWDVWDVDGPEGIDTMWGDHPIGPFQCFADTMTVVGRVTTPRPGGYHVYTPPTGKRNMAAQMRGLDYRGEGGYVLLPPSYVVTDEYAGEYEWRLTPMFPA